MKNIFELCDYGCGKKASFYFKNGKKCCKRRPSQCSKIKNKISKANKGHLVPMELINKIKSLMTGKPPWNKGLTKETDIRMKKTSDSLIGTKATDQAKKNMSDSQKRSRKDPNSYWNSNDYKKVLEQNKQRMLNGQAVSMNKCIKNPSKPELMLREIVKELYPTSEPQYPIFNYAVDIALVEYKIAIEYDGWYHFNCNENKEYHKQRQERIEKEGWNFLRYTIFQKFPTKEEVKNDILNLILRNGDVLNCDDYKKYWIS